MFPIGLIAVCFSAALYLIFSLLPLKYNDISFLTIFTHYLIAVIYGIYIISLKFYKKSKFSLDNTIYCLILFFISCFELNKSLNLFNSSVDWLNIYIIFSCLSLIAITIAPNLLKKYIGLVIFCLSASSILFLYYAIYLFPLYIISLPLLLVLGLSIHTYIPFALLLTTYIKIVQLIKENNNLNKYVMFGLLLPIILTASYVFTFNLKANHINKLYSESQINHSDKLPEWIYIAQKLDLDFFTTKVLKTSLLYDFSNGQFNWFDTPNRNLDEPKKHDPLVVISTFFTRDLQLDDDIKLKILRLNSHSRHKTQEKLWSGDNLEVKDITTNVELYPSLRIAYTEKEISIHNISSNSWRNQQEALFTFHLSPGSVATSLSLWINGVEEKAALTTKSKADSAYRQVVGVEARDPSVLHWQEGNTITVRVFPCTQEEDRKVKIGITSPLEIYDNRLIYNNIWFEGPPTYGAEERIKIKIMDSVKNLDLSNKFITKDNKTWTSSGRYQPNWKIEFDVLPILANSFSFAGYRYAVQELKQAKEKFEPSHIYLDLNSSWNLNEFESVLELFKGKKIYVSDNRFVNVKDHNRQYLFDKLTKLNFTLFPLYQLQNQKNTLIITKSTEIGPSMDDLKGSNFFETLKSGKFDKLYVFNIGKEQSQYFRTLAEFRTINYCLGSIYKLKSIVQNKEFAVLNTNPNEVEIDQANIKIIKDQYSNSKNTAPDHLKRLFDYNFILQQVGTNGLKTNYYNERLVRLAEEANVVTPFSSLIVLEKLEDYERFNIKKNLNGLQNATLKSDGAVPEPHEWILMIVIAAALIITIWLKKSVYFSISK